MVVFPGGSDANARMFPLGGPIFPTDEPSLIAAIGAGLSPLGLSAACVSVEGVLPALGALKCDLSGAVFCSSHRAAKAAGEITPGFFARRAEAFCNDGHFEGMAFTASLKIDDAIFGYRRDDEGDAVLVLEGCAAGVLELEISRADVEKALFSVVSKAAEEHGAEVKGVAVSWEQSGPKALALRVDVRAKAMFVETRVTANGRVEITDALEAVVSGLSCKGDGMMGSLAASFLKKEIPRFEGRSISLGGAFGGGLRLKDVSLHCESNSLRVGATA